MIVVEDFIVGYDNSQNLLHCGDIVRFKIHPDDWNADEKTLDGMILYDEDVFGFVFATPDVLSIHENLISCYKLKNYHGWREHPEWAQMYDTYRKQSETCIIGMWLFL